MNRHWLLGMSLAPLLGATSTLTQAVVTGVCCLALVTLHQALMATLRARLTACARNVVSLILAAALATCLQRGLDAWAWPLSRGLGHALAIMALQCVLIEAWLPSSARWRTLCAGLGGLLLACVVLGLCRQWLASLGLHLAALAPGALILLGLLLGLYNRLRPTPSPSRRQGSL